MSNQKNGNGIAMDLFCGTGTIAQLLSKSNQIQQVVGVDIVKEAIDDAKMNAEKNNNTKLQFYCADVGKFLVEHPQYKNKIDLIVLDPPRAGIVPKALIRTIELRAKAIIYISCNPSTQARDTLVLKEHGYELKKYALVDQFPHTAHIESIACFEKKE
jgi:tRNA/tmRNA/rRNA uracil-C5-methylase (TrmA/RlmC/RlmD family)